MSPHSLSVRVDRLQRELTNPAQVPPGRRECTMHLFVYLCMPAYRKDLR